MRELAVLRVALRCSVWLVLAGAMAAPLQARPPEALAGGFSGVLEAPARQMKPVLQDLPAVASLRAGSMGASARRAAGEGEEASSGARPQPSRLRAVGASLLLPGLGQIATGHPGRARAYLMAEAGSWIGFLASEIQGYVRKQGYVDYAEAFAGVADADGQEDWFFRNLGSYASYEDYRDDIARTARAIYGDDLAAREAYVVESLRGVPTWEWSSRAHRLEFHERRKASRDAYRRASLFIGGALLNRLVSALDAAWTTGRGQRGERRPAHALFFQPGEEGGYVCLRWSPQE